ncbi:SHOCT domain-containing protein [Bacillus spongiae]|uniref:SHOCT domain-containing protein n=1 Tax=Bacillus spongiae TaxID=2683610 RepID=A0ABU8HFA1_9BACI
MLNNIGKGKSAASAATPLDTASKIKRFAELRDSGIISEEEFNTKKKQLLGI